MLKHDYKLSKATLFDRFAVGIAAAVVAFITLFILWWVVIYLSFIIIPFKAIVFASLLIGVIGFATLDKYFIGILSPIWDFIASVVGIEERPL